MTNCPTITERPGVAPKGGAGGGNAVSLTYTRRDGAETLSMNWTDEAGKEFHSFFYFPASARQIQMGADQGGTHNVVREMIDQALDRIF